MYLWRLGSGDLIRKEVDIDGVGGTLGGSIFFM